MNVKVVHVGRILFLTPHTLGELFEKDLVVTRMLTVPASLENGWKRSNKPCRHKMYWYDNDDVYGKVFVTYEGYYLRIVEQLRKHNIVFTEEDRLPNMLEAPDLSKIKGVQWRPHQTEVFSKLLAYRGGIVKAPMALGKSFIIKQLCKVYPNSKVVITVNSLDIAKPIYEDLKRDVAGLGWCGTGGQRPNRVTVAVSKSLRHAPTDANIVLADEVHCLCTIPTMKELMRFNRAKMFGFTATPTGRSDGADDFLEAMFGPRLVDIGYEDAVEAGNVVQLKVKMVRINEGPDVSHYQDKYLTDRHGIINNPGRNKIIADWTNRLGDELGKDAQILVMVDKIEHAYLLHELLPDYTVVTGTLDGDRERELRQKNVIKDDMLVCSAKDRDRYRREFEAGTLKRCIATRIWEKGVDFRDLLGLVRADGLASSIAANQIPGRLSRLGKNVVKDGGTLIDFLDLFSNPLKGRSFRRVKSYKDNGWEITYHDPI
jgi:superfamily II DNA or RNA helicase